MSGHKTNCEKYGDEKIGLLKSRLNKKRKEIGGVVNIDDVEDWLVETAEDPLLNECRWFLEKGDFPMKNSCENCYWLPRKCKLGLWRQKYFVGLRREEKP